MSASNATPKAGGLDADGLRPSDGTVTGQVVDRTDGSPLPGATVRLLPTDRGQATDAEGRFTFEEVPAGTYEIDVSFVGYASKTTEVELDAGATVSVEVDLRPASLGLPDIVVTGTFRARAASEVYRPTSVLTGEALQERLQSSVPATLERVPGFSMESFGPGAARPNIRGMGGDRVLMLEDGQRTGDLYATASDHGVMVEPLSAERMEVIRGPASLLHGPNALGGVANVIRNDIPREQPDRVTGLFTTQAASVNNGLAAGGTAYLPAGNYTLRGEFTYRRAGDTMTPEGELDRTQLDVANASLGASRTTSWGLFGMSYRFYDNTYGIPGEFNGELIPGGHAGGVDIEATRHVGRLRVLYDQRLGFFDGIEFDANLTRYIHDEIERRRDGQQDIFGARFDQMTGEATLMLHHQHEPGGIRAEGAVGGSVRGTDISAFGASPGMRSGQSLEAALYGYEEFSRGPVRLQLGLRYDYRAAEPDDKRDILARTQEADAPIRKSVRARTFSGLSGAVSGLYTVANDWTVGFNVSRSFRSPHLQELYSDGPHLADFSFDIGEPDLDPEYGHGAELFVRGGGNRLNVELAGYFNRVQNYTFHRNTGQTWIVDRNIPVFEAAGADANFIGVEGQLQWIMLPDVELDASASYTRATRIENSNPLPFIPPLNGHASLRYTPGNWSASVGTKFAAAQNRVPNAIEIPGTDRAERPRQPTDGYGLLNASLGYETNAHGMRHTFTLRGDNLTNAVWRDHLSRTKDVAPQPGRNLTLTYRARF
ncbi:MAG: TonB-dependent receptor [Longimonas sp.]|uniref:TonB-dependent receptor n=1 Tax=Longimonas sp. TaxID=2039626 RepID=UPI00335303DC